jgi:hypothetical protein
MSRKVLKLSERVEAIKLHDGGKSSQDGAQIMGSLYIIYIYIHMYMQSKNMVFEPYLITIEN